MASKAGRKFDKSIPVTVHVPAGRVANLDAVHKVVCNTMGGLGCPACLSGYTVTYTELPYLVVDERLDVRAQ
ncbi:MAG TPA: hypothetical protein VFZ91_00865 [Allosphingosinicella sp.]